MYYPLQIRLQCETLNDYKVTAIASIAVNPLTRVYQVVAPALGLEDQWVGCLAELTLEGSVVVGADGLLVFHRTLGVQPFFKASEMYKLDAAIAFARCQEWISY